MLNVSRQQRKYDKYHQNLQSGTFITQTEVLYKHGTKFIIFLNVIMIQADTATCTAFFFSLLIHKQNDLMLLASKGVKTIGCK